MAAVPITFACGLYDRTLPLYTGEVKADGIDLNYLAIDHPREIFDRMQTAQEFDASEMSSSDFARHVAHGDCPFVALPVFVSRVFRHGHIAVNRKLINTPKDLAGKRIGVPLYGMTATIFICGLLQHDCGVDLSVRYPPSFHLARGLGQFFIPNSLLQTIQMSAESVQRARR